MTRLRVASNNSHAGRHIMPTCGRLIEIGLCPKMKNHPLCGWIFIVLDYCISVTERELINVTSFRCVSEILRLDNFFVILEL